MQAFVECGLSFSCLDAQFDQQDALRLSDGQWKPRTQVPHYCARAYASEACSVLERIRKDLADIIAQLKPRRAGVSPDEEHSLLDRATTVLKAVPHDIPQRNDNRLCLRLTWFVANTGRFLGQTLDL